MESFLRSWREDALSKQQYDSAIFVGDKLLALTNSDEDAIALAQIHFTAANYQRALSIIRREELLDRSTACKYLAAHCYVKQDLWEDAMLLLGEKNPTHLAAASDSARRKLQHMDRLGGNARLAKLHKRHEIPRQQERVDRSEDRDVLASDDLKYEAGMCYLRGMCHAKQNALDRAKDCYKCAVRIDIKCFEAFEQLTKHSLMSPAEEWSFLEGLDFDTAGYHGDQRGESDFVRNLYITRLSKYSQPEAMTEAIETLSTHYKLANNTDVLHAKAEIFFTLSRFQESLQITSDILSSDPFNWTVMPLHLALLHHNKDVKQLFALSHDLADKHPTESCSWLAIGTYYLTTNRISEARVAFSRATVIDQRFGPAWIGFGHTFAAEGEGDQAIAAYSTAAALMQGSHLPGLFIGMQEMAMGNWGAAKQHLNSAFDKDEDDPLLLNESGVVAYNEDNYNGAIQRFQLALQIAKANGAPQSQSITVRANLAQAYRKSGMFDEALEEFDEVIRLGSHDSDIFTSKALVLLELDHVVEAITALHEALAINPSDAIATELMDSGMKMLESSQTLAVEDEDAIDDTLRAHLSAVRKRQASSRRRGQQMDVDGR